MKLKKSACFFTLSSIALHSFAFEPSTKTTTVRIPEISSSVPESCKGLAEIAYDSYFKEWRSNLSIPLNVDQTSIDKAESSIHNEIERGRIPLNTNLAPQSTVAVFLNHPDLTGTQTSLFISCEKRLGYVSKRGGINDATRWFGPFKF
ncbi:MAG: hypothetical protein AB1437_06510 [Pseudomonadota bacterium]